MKVIKYRPSTLLRLIYFIYLFIYFFVTFRRANFQGVNLLAKFVKKKMKGAFWAA